MTNSALKTILQQHDATEIVLFEYVGASVSIRRLNVLPLSTRAMMIWRRVILPCLTWFILVSSVVAIPAYAQVLSDTQSQTAQQVGVAPISTLGKIKERGFLICGAAGLLPGFAARNEDGAWVGFDVDICRALAAATLGDPNLVEFRAMSGEARFAQLQVGEVDIMVRNGAWTMGRDVNFGARFVTPTFFDGLSFMVRTETGFVSAYVLENIKVCVSSVGEDLSRVRDFFFENQANSTEVIYEDRGDLLHAYRSGLCDAIAAPVSQLQFFRRSLPDPGQHRIMPEIITKLPIGPVVRQGDQEWEHIVRSTIFALINAEELGVTSVNLSSMMSSRTPAIRRLLGLEPVILPLSGLAENWAYNVIMSVGSYREIYDRHFGPQTGAALQRGINSIWSQGGLLYAPAVR